MGNRFTFKEVGLTKNDRRKIEDQKAVERHGEREIERYVERGRGRERGRARQRGRLTRNNTALVQSELPEIVTSGLSMAFQHIKTNEHGRALKRGSKITTADRNSVNPTQAVVFILPQ